MRAFILGLSLMLCLLQGKAFAQMAESAIAPMEFETEVQRQRFREFSEVLRCPKCQNQNLAGSAAGVAGDLRRELQRLVRENKGDEEIITYMTDRYGSYILYDPPLDRATLVLWFGPLVLVGIALLTLKSVLGRQKSVMLASQLSDSEKQRARDALDAESKQVKE